MDFVKVNDVFLCISPVRDGILPEVEGVCYFSLYYPR